MQYNGPFDQPTNPNASYTNGNPATGTDGSIPPAPAIELPQREIVAVINYAFENNLVDFNQFHCVGATNSITTQLLSAIEGMISAGIKLQFSSQSLIFLQVAPPSSGSQSVPSSTLTQINCLTDTLHSTLVTSTFTGGSTLTIGSGEDGLWNFALAIDFNNQPAGWATYCTIKRTRGSTALWFLDAYGGVNAASGSNSTALDLYSSGSAVIDAQVGDTFKFYTSVQGSLSATNFTITQSGPQSGIPVLPAMAAYRILPAPFITG